MNTKAMFKITTITFSICLLIGIVIFFAVGKGIYLGSSSVVTFVNDSNQIIDMVQISLSGQSCTVQELEINGEAECTFKDLHDSSYSVAVTLRNGAVYSEASLGYVTNGISFTDIITINKSGEITLVSNTGT